MAGLLSAGGEFTRAVRNPLLDSVTGEAREALGKIAVALEASSAADSTLISFAPDAIRTAPKGIGIFGVDVIPGGKATFEGLIDRRTPWNNESAPCVEFQRLRGAMTRSCGGIPPLVRRLAAEARLRGSEADDRPGRTSWNALKVPYTPEGGHPLTYRGDRPQAFKRRTRAYWLYGP
ncbi:hypothetical protein [Streptomyces cyaneofuscatus]|uniref:hypothetical protein n=1 Tax=Streptomyces cyaneofuscatus TaxID=66883 RepID=UPI001EF1E1CB|nr:hypothetical protein [Streptomyces cyaneofuscatus]